MSTLSIKGDLHIPDHMINALGLKPDVELNFERQGDAIVIRPEKTNECSKVEEDAKQQVLAAQLRGNQKKALQLLDELDRLGI